MISSSVGSSQYSWRILHEYLPGWGNLSGKIISIKRNHQSGVYFQIAISLIGCVATFSGQLYFWRSYFFTLFQSDYFDTAVTFSEQLCFQSSCFFLLFFTTVTYSQQLFFQNSFFFRVTILQSSHFLRIRSPLWQLLFGTTVFSLFRIKISKKELLFQSRYSTQYQKILEKANFSEKQYSALPTFSGELFF